MLMPSVVMQSSLYTEHRNLAHCDECRYAECQYAECHYAECHGTVFVVLVWKYLTLTTTLAY